MIKNGLIILLFLLPVVAFAQYPNNPNKIRLGFQTTGNGLIYRGSGAPTLFPTGYNSAFQFYDTIANTLWVYQDSFWYLTNTIRRSTPPPYSSISSGLTLVYGHGVWQDTDDYHRYEYVANDSIEAWVPATGTYYWPSEPSDIAATGSTGAVKYTAGLWHKVPTDSLFRYDGSDWVFIGAGGINYLNGDAGTVQDIQQGDTIKVLGGYGMNTSAGATDALTVTADTTQLATPYDVQVVQDSLDSHIAADGDLSPTNEIQQIDTLSLSGTTLSASLSSDGTAAKTVNLSPLLSGYVTGSGTAGRVPRWTSSSALGDGVLRDDGTLLAINGVTVSGYSLYDYGTSSWRLPVGTTAQRPTAQTGAHRYNSSLGYSETYGASAWLQSDLPAGTTNNLLWFNGTSWTNGGSGLTWNGSRDLTVNGGAAGTFLRIGNAGHYFWYDPVGTGGNMHFRTASMRIITFPGATSAGIIYFPGSDTETTQAIIRSSTGRTISNGNLIEIATQQNLTNASNIYSFNISNTIAPDALNNISAGSFGGIRLAQSYTAATSIAGNKAVEYFGINIVPSIYRDASEADGSYGIYINPTLTGSGSAAGWRGINNITTAGRFINSENAAVSHHQGNFGIGSGTTTPARTLHVGGEARITDLTTDAMTKIVGADGDGDLSASAPGFGLSVTGGVPQVDTTKIATLSDLSGVSVTTLYTGDGTIATDRTVTLAQDKTLVIQGTSNDIPGIAWHEDWGYSSDWAGWGYYRTIYSDDYFSIFTQNIQDYDSTVIVRLSSGDMAGDFYTGLQMDGAGNLSLTGYDDSGTSGGLNLHSNPTVGGYGARLAGGAGIEFDTDTGGKFVYQVNNSTKATMDGTGLGIGDTSPEKSLDVAGMGKFRQISGQDNTPSIGTNANMGTGRSASITSGHSSDVAGRISFTSGTTLTAGEWVTLTWGTAFDNAPAVVMMPENANAASIVPYLYVVPSTTGVSIVVNVTGVPYEGLTFEFNYIVIQGK